MQDVARDLQITLRKGSMSGVVSEVSDILRRVMSWGWLLGACTSQQVHRTSSMSHNMLNIFGVSPDMTCLVTSLEVLGHAAVSGKLEGHLASNLQVWHAMVSAIVMTDSQPCVTAMTFSHVLLHLHHIQHPT